ncbi:pantetheine-phosphate adenylyltransferase [Enterovirga rhinocerotis]|uniref:Phosphopantetheine adenylyltransferase n=1 Tax=Enterovirga rhinocerotis TaxID=1339210 RepID=A0A4R7BII1_9HYPH|nr:pantetheine-phosphate adenylyltransferase [Enterovirga rhinocerotis]TDR85124.1 phosphopantetheine adenylyltransferase [Enterovirga rhinocerotis]
MSSKTPPRRSILYSGSFDPLTNGHLDVCRRACALADRLVVAIGVHSSKTPVFPAEDRADMIREVVGPIAEEAGVVLEVVHFGDLVIEAARRLGCSSIIRGLRDGTDLDYEMQMAAMNETMAPDIATIFVPASPATRPITATLVRQVAQMGGDVKPFVPRSVAGRLEARFSKKG